MRVKKHPISNEEVIEYFSKKETWVYLANIYNGVISSERHDIVSSMFAHKKLDFGIYSRIFRLASAQFLEDDHRIDTQLWNILSKIFDKLDTTRMPGIAFAEKEKHAICHVLDMRHKYIFHVFVPEGIIKFLQEKFGWTWKAANHFFIDADSRITEKELEDFDQEINNDIKKETERKRRQIYDSNDEDSDENVSNISPVKLEKKVAECSMTMVRSKVLRSHMDNDPIKKPSKQNGIKSEKLINSHDSLATRQYKPLQTNNENISSNMNYCIESSMSSNGTNFVIKMKRVKEEHKDNSQKEIKPKVQIDDKEAKEINEEKALTLYCICRREDDGSFMIACDVCKEWYHPRCLNFSTERMRLLKDKEWWCPKCKGSTIPNFASSKVEMKYKDIACAEHSKKVQKVPLTYSQGTKKESKYEIFRKENNFLRTNKVTKPEKGNTPLHPSEKSAKERKIQKIDKGKNTIDHTLYRDTPLLYCLCRKQNDETFMVGCDFCDEWYHPRCLNLSNEKAMELAYREWSCPRCIKKKRNRNSK